MRRLFLLTGALLAAPVFAANAQTTVLRAGHLVDPANAVTMDDQYVTIVHGRITGIQPTMPSVHPDRFIDLSGQWVMPGLFDAHSHLTYNFEDELCEGYIKHGTGYRALIGLKEAQSMLAAGFTTVRDLGNAGNYADTDLREAIEGRLFAGPTIINAGKIIAPLGGQSDMVAPEMGPCWAYEYIDADGVEAVRKAVRQNILYGARVIKVVNDQRGGRHGIYSPEELQVAVDEAHRAGLAIAVHAKDDQTARPAVLAGADSIEHGYRLSDEVLKLMAERQTYLVPTDLPAAYLEGSPAAVARKVAVKVDRLRRAYRLGVPLVFGTDTTFDEHGLTRGEMAPVYLEVWVQAGIPNMVILQGLTSKAAKLLRVDNARGRIMAGQFADIIAMASDPVADVVALRRVDFVMKDGAVIRDDHAGPSKFNRSMHHHGHRL